MERIPQHGGPLDTDPLGWGKTAVAMAQEVFLDRDDNRADAKSGQIAAEVHS